MEASTRRRLKNVRLIVLLIILAALTVAYFDMRQNRLDSDLMNAVLGGETATVHSLLKSGADPNVRLITPGRTVPRVSVWERLLAMLLRRKAPQQPPIQHNYKTALMFASSLQEVEIAEDLIAHGAGIQTKLENGNTALLISSRACEPTALRLVSLGASTRVHDSEGMSPMLFAAQGGHDPLVQALLDKGADIGDSNKAGATPLLLAAMNHHESTVKLLIDRGADVRNLIAKSAAAQRLTVRSFASRFSRPSTGSTEVDVVQMYAGSPLMAAAWLGSAALIQATWDRSADRILSPVETVSALDLAIQSGQIGAVRALLDRGVPVNPPSDQLEPPLVAAARSQDTQILRLLLQKGADVNKSGPSAGPPLLAAARGGNFEGVKLLIEHGADMTAVNDVGQNSLMCAVNSAEVVKFLLTRRLDVNMKDHKGQTALMLTVSEKVAELLIAKGAMVDVKDFNGRTALSHSTTTMNAGIARVLLKHGANPLLPDDTGATPLALAQQQPGNPVRPLLEDAMKKR